MSISAYVIYPDNVGELRAIDEDAAPPYVITTIRKVERIEGTAETRLGEPERCIARLIGYRWVGKVREFAFIYDAREETT